MGGGGGGGGAECWEMKVGVTPWPLQDEMLQVVNFVKPARASKCLPHRSTQYRRS